MNGRVVKRQKTLAIRWLVIAAAVFAVMLTLWWLVSTTNSEGQHDAKLLPFVTLVPLSIALFHMLRWRWHR